MPMMGGIGNMIGNKPMTSEVFVTEDYMRSDDGDRSTTIYSLPEGKFYSLDNRKKTYFEMSFDDMMNMLSNTRAQMQGDIEQETDYNPDDFEFSVSVEDLGGGEAVAGYQTDHKLMKMELKYTTEMTDDQGNTQTASGKFYTISEVWLSKDVPGYDIVNDFGQKYADQMGQAFSQGGGGRYAAMQQAFMSDGRIQPALEKLAEEMKKLDGAPLRTVSYLVIVPEDQELDMDAVLNHQEVAQEQKQERRRRGLGNLARNALKNRGLNVGNDNDDAEEMEGQITKQQLLTKTETVYQLIETVPDDPSRFTVPANYEKVDMPSYYDSDN